MKDTNTYVQLPIRDTYFKALSIIKECLPEHEHLRERTSSVTVNSRLTKVLGRCVYRGYSKTNEIEISLRLYELHNEDELLHTLIHELLHTYRDSHNHGPNWKRRAAIIKEKTGIVIERIHHDIPGLEEIDKKNKAGFRCQKCGREVYRGYNSKFTKNYAFYRCGMCGGEFEKI